MTDVATTRRALHGVAELVLAGPQFRTSGTIRLRVVPGGFATVAAPALAIDGEYLVAGEHRIAINGSTCGALAKAIGVAAGAPADLYHDGSGVGPDEPVTVAADAVRFLLGCFEVGDAALRGLRPDATPVLWPEHFDLGITDDEVNYGVSLGDAVIPEPYAYVGPWRTRAGTFWNVPFGAARPLAELPGADAVLGFFTAGRDQARRDPVI
jgi:hypothetical protein